MPKIKTYKCDCGEDIYEDDTYCLNCLEEVNQTKFRDEEYPDIKQCNS